MMDDKTPAQDHDGGGADERTIKAIMFEKWGPEYFKDFSENYPGPFSLVIRETVADMEYFWEEWQKNAHEHTRSILSRVIKRWIEIRTSQGLTAHLINRIQGIEETEKNFFVEYQNVFPYIEDALIAHADAPGHMEPEEGQETEKQQIDVLIHALGPEDVKAVYEGTFNTPCAAVLRDAAEAMKKDREAADRKKRAEKKAHESIDEINLKDAKWLNIYHGKITDDLMRLSGRDFVTLDGLRGYWIGQDGQRYDVENMDKLFNSLQTSTKKIFDMSVMLLAIQTFYGSGRNSITPQVRIPLIPYLEKNGHDLTPRTMETKEEQAKENERIKNRLKQFKRAIKKDFDALEVIRFTGEEKQGRHAGDYARLRLISGHRISKGFIYVNFDIDMAHYLVNAYSMQFPLCFMLFDNNNPNSYSVNRKILLHTVMDNNFFAGTDGTLSVMALLNAAPEITTIQELQERGQRNWKDKIKKPLEVTLNDGVRVGFLKRWEYRHPKSGTRYTPEEAQELTWDLYSTLMVDFILTERPPGEAERRAKLIEEKAAAEAAGTLPKKKRGRPKKQAKTKKGV